MKTPLVSRLLLVALIGAFGSSVAPARAQYVVSNIWSISTSEGRSYVTSASNNDRGLAYNPVTDHVYIVGRSNGLKVAVLNASDGSEIKFLDITGVSVGTFALSLISVADDGVIYGANLTTASATTPFKIYRWENEDAVPTVVYSGNPGGTQNGRWGDCLDIRGNGQSTEILAADGATAPAVILAAVFKPIDDPITQFGVTTLTVTGAGPLDLQKGLCFGPTNSFWAKRFNVATSLRLFTYDLGTATATAFLTNTIAANVSAICLHTNTSLLVGVETANAASPHNLRVYDATGSGSLPGVATIPFPTPYVGNGNAVGFVDIGNSNVFAIDSNNGVLAAKIIYVPQAQIAADPASNNVVQGGYTTLSADVTGVVPLFFQWNHNGNPLTDETNRTLLLTNITPAQAGQYTLFVSNAFGTDLSGPGTVTVEPTVLSSAMTLLWQLPPGSRPYINTDASQRGIAYNPATHHVLIVSRTGSNGIHVLNADTGAHLWSMNIDTNIILLPPAGGTFSLNLVETTSDGVVYAGNLTQTGDFRLYKWDNDSAEATPQLVWSGNPSRDSAVVRWGDAIDLRGSSLNPQLVLSSRNSNYVSIIDLYDVNLAAKVAHLETLPAELMGLGVAFGADTPSGGFTVWGKFTGLALRQVELVELDPNVLTATVLATVGGYPAMGPIGVQADSNLLAGISIERPDNVRLFDITSANSGSIRNIDTEFFPTDNANGNGTGNVAFGPNRIYAVDSNNGVMAWSYSYDRPACPAAALTITRTGPTEIQLSWTGAHRLQSSTGLSDAPTWSAVSGTAPVTIQTQGETMFFRLVCP
jgi:hypothetical protein